MEKKQYQRTLYTAGFHKHTIGENIITEMQSTSCSVWHLEMREYLQPPVSCQKESVGIIQLNFLFVVVATQSHAFDNIFFLHKYVYTHTYTIRIECLAAAEIRVSSRACANINF